MEFSSAGFAGEEREGTKEEMEGPVGPPCSVSLRSQTSVSWGCGLCVWEVLSASSAGLVLLQPALGTTVCWQRLPCAVVAAGLDRPPLCLVS